MEDNKEKAVAEADAATDRLQKSLKAARSIVRDYKAKLCRRSAEARQMEPKPIFRFER